MSRRRDNVHKWFVSASEFGRYRCAIALGSKLKLLQPRRIYTLGDVVKVLGVAAELGGEPAGMLEFKIENIYHGQLGCRIELVCVGGTGLSNDS